MDLSFFSSDTGVTISWICTVLGFGYALLQKSQVMHILVRLNTHSVLLEHLELFMHCPA